MPKLDILNVSGETVDSIELNENIFGIEPNMSVLHEVVKNYLANQRQGTQSAQTRAEVTGTTSKPFRQKGTGRARQGSLKSPINRGGGVIFAPKPRDYSYKLPRKVKVLGMKSALSGKVRDNEFIVLNELNLDAPKTKDMVNVLANVSEKNTVKNITKTLIVLADKNDNVMLSANNIPKVKVTYVGMLNVYDLLNHDEVVITKGAIDKLEEVYA
ncbi:50S ribosomal protein L4 [Clostridiaceae bacterium HSG29]|nr:50S ribosomal protein L4 [Clostridiaceae bacterium HSG29]